MGQEEQDALLQRYLTERDPAVAQECLEGLLSGYVEPLIRDITRYKSRTSCSAGRGYEAQDEDDIRSEVVVQLISRLRDLKMSGAQSPIENFRGYVATTTYNAYYKYVRMKCPARWRLKNRIRYLMDHAEGLKIWKDEREEFLCGLANWRGRRTCRLKNAKESPRNIDEFVQAVGPSKGVAQLRLEELVKALLEWRGSTVPLDELVGIVAELQGIKDSKQVSSQPGEGEENAAADFCELLPACSVDVVKVLEQRSALERLWQEICELPMRQRVALLLNLRDRESGDALVLFTLTGVASLRRIAQAIETSPEEFALLWNKLPMEDTAIALRLGITRQQVINLRKSARERLTRRMAAF